MTSEPVKNPLRLYVKTWCPWCIKAIAMLDGAGYRYELIDVEADEKDYRDMIALSGQRLTPTLVVGDEVLPDFGPKELTAFLERLNLQPG